MRQSGNRNNPNLLHWIPKAKHIKFNSGIRFIEAKSKTKKVSMKKLIFLTLITILAAGCSDTYFDDVPVHSAHEFLTRESRGEELIFAINNAQIASVALIAGAKEAPVEDIYPDPGSPEDGNELVLKAGEKLPGRLIPFVFIPNTQSDPAAFFESFHKRRARGLALWRLGEEGERPLGDPVFEPLYNYAEINGVPVFVSIKPDYLDELSHVLNDHHDLKVIGGGLLGLYDDFQRLQEYLEYHPNLFVDIGFDGDADFVDILDAMTKDQKGVEAFFERMKDRLLFAGGLLFDHRLFRKGLWGMQVYKIYRSFLEKGGADMRVRDASGYWRMRHIPGLALKKARLERIYHNNFMKILGQTFHDPVPSEFDSLIIKAPPSWRFDPASPTRLIAALVSPREKLVTMISTQRLRDIFAGKLTDWREINGEPGPIRVASLGPLAQIVANQLDAPLVIKVELFDDPMKLRRGVEESGDLLGIIPFGDLNGRLSVLSVDGDNPCASNVKYCASKAAPTVSNYFSTYPLLIPVAYSADESAEKFDPFKIRTVFIGGRIRAEEPDLNVVTPHMQSDGLPDIQATRMRPIYEILPYVRRNDFNIFLGDTPESYEAFLMRCLGARAIISPSAIHRFDAASARPPANVISGRIRGLPVRLAGAAGDFSPRAFNVLTLAHKDKEAVNSGLAAGADMVVSSEGLEAVKGLGALEVPLGSFLGDEESMGAFAVLSFYDHRLSNIEIVPTQTLQGEVQRRFGADARNFLLSVFKPLVWEKI